MSEICRYFDEKMNRKWLSCDHILVMLRADRIVLSLVQCVISITPQAEIIDKITIEKGDSKNVMSTFDIFNSIFQLFVPF